MPIFDDDYLIIREDGAIVNGDYCTVHGDHAIINGDFCEILGRGAIINGDFCKYLHKPAVLHGDGCKHVKTIKPREDDKRYTQAKSISGFVSNMMCSGSNIVSTKTAGISGAIILTSPGNLYVNGERVTDYTPGIGNIIVGRQIISKGRAIAPTEPATPKPAAHKKRASEDKKIKPKRSRSEETD